MDTNERLDAVTALVGRLQQQVADLTAANARLSALVVDSPQGISPSTVDADSAGGDLSRRRLMRILGSTAAVGAATVGATLASATPAAAAPGNALIIGNSNDGGTTITALTASPTPNSSTFAAINNDTNQPIGVFGQAGPRSGLNVGSAAVIGDSRDSTAVAGFSRNGLGVLGSSSQDTGVYGNGATSGVFGIGSDSGVSGQGFRCGTYGRNLSPLDPSRSGVEGSSIDNPGVLGHSDSGHGVVGLAQNSVLGTFPPSGVLGQAVGGRGITGVATTGTGAFGQAGAGAGVLGTAATTGIAGQFSGGRAQLYLVPSTTTTGHPTTGTHKIGELFLDKVGALYLCKTAGTPGTWKLIG